MEVGKLALDTGKGLLLRLVKKIVDKVINPSKRVANIVNKYTDASVVDIQQMARKLNENGPKETRKCNYHSISLM